MEELVVDLRAHHGMKCFLAIRTHDFFYQWSLLDLTEVNKASLALQTTNVDRDKLL
jgi:hypothetical protein